MSISSKNNNIKIWNIKNWECILNMYDVYKKGWLFSACFISEKNNNYIITSNCNGRESDSIKVFDFKGTKIKKIKDSKDETLFISTYYDKDFSNNYIITGNCNYVKSYDYDKNELYHIYSDNKNGNHYSIVIKEDKQLIRLMESCLDGYLRIWDFHSTSYLSKIKVSNECLKSLCLWNNDYLFIACSDKTIKVINLKTGLSPICLKGHSDEVLTIKKIIHPTYGECLISQGWGNEKIKLWIKC
jgi:WD40 repeat protein